MSEDGGAAARMWTWLRADASHMLLGVALVVGVLYVTGVALFDNSTEDAARDRAASGKPESSYSAEERTYLDVFGDQGISSSDALALGKQWCRFFASDRTGRVSRSLPVLQQLDSAYGKAAAGEGLDDAARNLCPDTYAQWTSYAPSYDPGPDQYDWDRPDDGYEREWGPRG